MPSRDCEACEKERLDPGPKIPRRDHRCCDYGRDTNDVVHEIRRRWSGIDLPEPYTAYTDIGLLITEIERLRTVIPKATNA